MPSDARQLQIFLAGVALVLLLPAAFAGVRDPYQVFRSNEAGYEQLQRPQRLQVAGLIRTHLRPDAPFRTLLLGTSLSENLRPSMVRDVYGHGELLKLTMEGSLPKTKGIVAEAALRKGVATHVLWEIADDYHTTRTHAQSQPRAFPAYLFNTRALDDLRYVFDLSVLERAANSGPHWVPYDDYGVWDLDAGVTAGFVCFNTMRSLGTKAALLAKRRRRFGPPAQDLSQYRPHYPALDHWLVRVVRAHPDVHFDLFFPPRSAYSYATMNPRDLRRRFFLRRYLVEATSELPNVAVHGFDTDAWITGDLRHYKDPTHFSPAITEYTLRAITDGSHRLTRADLDAYEADWMGTIASFEVDPTRSVEAGDVDCP